MPAHQLPVDVHTNCASYFPARDLFRMSRCSAVHRDLYQTAAFDSFIVCLGVQAYNIWRTRSCRTLTAIVREWDGITPILRHERGVANAIAAQAEAELDIARQRYNAAREDLREATARLESAFANLQ